MLCEFGQDAAQDPPPPRRGMPCDRRKMGSIRHIEFRGNRSVKWDHLVAYHRQVSTNFQSFNPSWSS
ncbi:hypothetical protein IE4872_PD00138 (plasmid) [Rhizobium gallicum]|uniref:Uncharacterized protein n=1 Tax=Rhizobium gallicum TaxID=56730 RepID=A0A1L5NS09_9HYPH|nr:hypothetical protein IE4872_PD00138 [Rhizobium gallicum]